MKSVLLLVHDDVGQESRMQAALDLTRALDGHLACLDVVNMPFLAADGFISEAEVALLEEEQERESDNCAMIRDRLSRENVAWDLIEHTGETVDWVFRNAGLADVIVMNRRLDDPFFPALSEALSTIVIKSHKPVVAVPEEGRGFDTTGRALVAWDGSLPAMAALTAAVPLLKMASSVLIYEIKDGARPASAKEAAVYLSRHGIHAEVRYIASDDKPTADLILNGLTLSGAAYCVMGAFGHSPLRERLLGGVTRHMLSKSPVPLVLAH